MKGAQTLGDAIGAALLERDGLATKAVPIGFITEDAVDRFKNRCLALGLNMEACNSMIDKGKAAIWKGLEACESPIEKAVLPWLVFEDYGPSFLTIPAGVHVPKREEFINQGDLVIIPQFAFAKYRMDFGVVARCNDAIRIVCVECDGAKYHAGKTNDAGRDAYLRSWGIPTIRETGKVCKEEPWRVSSRVASTLREMLGG